MIYLVKLRYSPRQTPEDLEELVEKEQKTNYYRIRLAKRFESEYKVRLSKHTIRNILHRMRIEETIKEEIDLRR